jgi:S-adenosylmethionine:tRNA ribosyltransferase-isomerase
VNAVAADTLDFELPDALSASEPPEARGIGRDGVRLMATRAADDSVVHTSFRSLGDHLSAGDVLVVNSSATVNAAFDARIEDGRGAGSHVVVHLSAPIGEDRWAIELRRLAAIGRGTEPLPDARAGSAIRLRGGAIAVLLGPFAQRGGPGAGVRLWTAHLSIGEMHEYARRWGRPIRYSYVPLTWPIEYYQTVFADEPGSAEMPSAGRAFTREMVRDLERRGVQFVSVLLHAGVASAEVDEPPAPERFHVDSRAAADVNDARSKGGRVIAVGTTVVRALESTGNGEGRVQPGAGWTDHVVGPDQPVRTVDGLLTGFHAPRASHLAMLESIATRQHLEVAYGEALRRGYLWHEFGDLHLILR